MSEPTNTSPSVSPMEFRRTPGVSGWHVTSAGPQAVFTAASLARAAEFVSAVVAGAVWHGVTPDIDLRAEGVTVRIRTDSPVEIPAAAAGFAAAVSEDARARGIMAAPHLVQTIGLYVAQHPGVVVRPFFTAALGYENVGEGDAIDPLRRGPQLAFNPIRGGKEGRGRTHLDVYVPADQARARVEAALAAGGRLVDDKHAPAWWTIASPDNHGIDIAAWPDTRE